SVSGRTCRRSRSPVHCRRLFLRIDNNKPHALMEGIEARKMVANETIAAGAWRQAESAIQHRPMNWRRIVSIDRCHTWTPVFNVSCLRIPGIDDEQDCLLS